MDASNLQKLSRLYAKLLHEIDSDVKKIIKKSNTKFVNMEKMYSTIKEFDLASDVVDIQTKYNEFAEILSKLLKNEKLSKISEFPFYVESGKFDTLGCIYHLFLPFVKTYDKIKGLVNSETTTMTNVYEQLKGDALVTIDDIGIFNAMIDVLCNIFEQTCIISLSAMGDDSLLVNKYELEEQTDAYLKYKTNNQVHNIAYKTNINMYITLSSKLIDLYDDQYASLNDDINKIGENYKQVLETRIGTIQVGLLKKQAALDSSFAIAQYGGDNFTTFHFTEILNMIDGLTSVNRKIRYLKKLISSYKYHEERYLYYVQYLHEITINRSTTTYAYLNKGICDRYLKIILYIFDQFAKIEQDQRIAYFERYHWITMLRMKNLLLFLQNIENDKDIDILNTTGPIRYDITIFNSFKDILDAFYATYQTPLNSYGILDADAPRIFRLDKTNDDILYFNSAIDELKKLHFTKLFQTAVFTYTPLISKYICVNEKTAKKKGQLMLTLSYRSAMQQKIMYDNSGQGIAQNFIKNIAQFDEVYMRIFEICGKTRNFSYYLSENLEEKIYVYKLATWNFIECIDCSDDEMIYNSRINAYELIIPAYKSSPASYIKINNNDAKRLTSFDDFIKQIKNIRLKQGRLLNFETNGTYTTSFLIYDFIVNVQDTFVRFVLIDAPCRNEVMKLNINDYMSKNKVNYDVACLHSTLISSINNDPFCLVILCPNIIARSFNELDDATRQYIINAQVDNNSVNKWTTVYMQELQAAKDPRYAKTINFLQEIAIRLLTKIPTNLAIKDLFMYALNDPAKKNAFKFLGASSPSGFGLDLSRWISENFLSKQNTIVQFQSIVMLHLMRRILTLPENENFNRQHVLQTIWKNVVEHFHINCDTNMLDLTLSDIYTNESLMSIVKLMLNFMNKPIIADKIAPSINSTKDIKEHIISAKMYNQQVYTLSSTQPPVVNYKTQVLTEIHKKNIDTYMSHVLTVQNKQQSKIQRLLEIYTKQTTLKVNNTNVQVNKIDEMGAICMLENNNVESKIHQEKLFSDLAPFLHFANKS